MHIILRLIRCDPYLYIFILVFGVLVFVIVAGRISTTWKAILYTVAAIFLALGLAEGYLAGRQGLGLAPQLSENYFLLSSGKLSNCFPKDDVRGYAIAKNIKLRSVVTLGNKSIYDVVYTTNRYGLRISPHDFRDLDGTLPKNFENVVFFGDSCTFGEGVQDDETWPFLFEENSGGKYRSYNLAMRGYGPHQMLRILETGLLDHIITDKKPSVAIFLTLPQHIIRSSCKYPYFNWDIDGPRYDVNSVNKIKYAGKFNENSKLKYKIFRELARSHLISESFWIKQLLGWNITDNDRDIFIKIIAKAREIFSQKYHGKFYVILWANGIWFDNTEEYNYIVKELRKLQINLIETKDIFNKYNTHKDKNIFLIKNDEHPNKLAYQRIADYMVNYINCNVGE